MSAVQVGAAFELLTSAFLRRCKFDIRRTGGPLDYGVDFRGEWHLSETKRVPVVGQCKWRKKAIGPAVVREVLGTLHGRHDVLLVLVSTAG